jgi:hypothetical protein
VPLGPQYGAATPQRPGLTSPLFPHDNLNTESDNGCDDDQWHNDERGEEDKVSTEDSGESSEAAPCPLQPCYFAKWDIFADTSDCQYAMGFPVCILDNFLPILPISCHILMSK